MGKEAQNSKIRSGKKVAVGLSGGVDSALSAALLAEQGYEVTGVFLECWRAPGCRTDEDRKDALEVALKLGIPYKVLDFKREYYERVVEYFYREYEEGRTPNPDTMCNREIKFGMFYEWAMENGFDAVATGHYSRIAKSHELRVTRQEYFLQRGADGKKDQSYFLYQLRPEQLAHVLFPIGGMRKSEVRAEAKKRNLPVAEKPDSQGICFIGDINVRRFLEERIKPKAGDVVLRLSVDDRSRIAKLGTPRLAVRDDKAGLKSFPALSSEQEVVGEHEGAWFYTIGQRLGREIDQEKLAKLAKKGVIDVDPTNMPHVFVIEKDVEANVLVAGFEENLERSEFEVEEINWLIDESRVTSYESRIFVRIRNTGSLLRARFKIHDSRIKIKTDRSLKGVASGQACVCYSDSSLDAVVLGGGVIV